MIILAMSLLFQTNSLTAAAQVQTQDSGADKVKLDRMFRPLLEDLQVTEVVSNPKR